MQHRLKQIFEHGYAWDTIEDDPYHQEWQTILNELNRPIEDSTTTVEYV
jgi:D-mannonate dehydratase